MKVLCETVVTFFLTLGAFVGAGFLSGKEIVVYFSGGINYIFVGAITFFLVLILFFLGIKNIKDNKFFSLLQKIGNFIFLVGMVSGMNALEKITFNRNFYFFSAISLFLANLISSKGIEGIKKLSLILMPISILIVNCVLIVSKNGEKLSTFSVQKGGVLTSVLYVFINVFPLIPFLKKTADKKKLKAFIAPIILFCIFFFLQAFFILKKVKNYQDFSLPLLVVSGSGILSFYLKFALILGTFTSLLTFYFPFYDEGLKKGKLYPFIVSVLAFLLALLGFDVVVKHLYPIIGVIGAVYFFHLAILLLNKNFCKRDNKDKEEKIMSKKKKNKVRKLTEEQYNEYLMALKDEVPPEIIRKTEGE